MARSWPGPSTWWPPWVRPPMTGSVIICATHSRPSSIAGAAQEAIRRLEAAQAADPGRFSDPERILLALAHQELGPGHLAEARRWLAEVKAPRSIGNSPSFWVELAMAILHREAVALILDDPIFPADPFAP